MGRLCGPWIERRYAVHLGVRQCQRLFRQRGFRLRKPRPQIAHADPELQNTHKKIQALSSDPTVDLWAMHEVHFQQHGSRCRMWLPPETKDPVLLHHPTRRSVGYFGAVRLRDGKFFFRREMNKFNAMTCWQFLKDLRAASTRTARRVVVIADNAKYHHARLHREWRQQHTERFAVDFLPPYSPDLNPTERVWKLTRRRCRHNRYFPRLDEVMRTVETEFANWIKPNNTLRTICAIA